MFTKRKFGVEIEVLGLNQDAALEALRSAGIRALVVEAPISHERMEIWKIVSDFSLNSDYPNCEVVSPPLEGDRGLDEVTKVMDALKAAGGFVDITCGFHVHHDAADLTEKSFRSILAFYWRFESTIDEMIHSSRRSSRNEYCVSISHAWNAPWIESEDLRRRPFIRIQGSFEAPMGPETRYCKVNLDAYFRHGTVEFRQYHGTLDREAARSWVIFTQAIVEKSVKGRASRKVVGRWTGWTNMMMGLGWLPYQNPSPYAARARDYLAGTRKEFAQCA